MKRFYFILYLVSSAVWSQVDCSLPTIQGTELNFDANFNAISGNYNATNYISSIDEISSTNYLAPEIVLNDGFKATSGSSVLISVENCPAGNSIDLYIKDVNADTGAEPSPSFIIWDSPDIWVRRNNDSGLTHESPVKNQINYIKVRVTNRGNQPSTGQETVTVHWGPNSLMFGRCGRLLTDTNCFGFGTLTVGVIPAGGSAVLTFPFTPQIVNSTDYQYAIQGSVNTGANFNVGANSSHWSMIQYTRILALKNLNVVDNANRTASILVGSHEESSNSYNLELLVTNDETGKPIYQEAEVRLKMDANLYNSWQQGAMQTERMANTTEDNVKIVTGNNALLKGLTMGTNFIGSVELDFNYLIEELTDKTNYTYHLVQRDAVTNEIVGGCAFAIEKEIRDPFLAEAPDKEVDKFEPVTLSAFDIGEQAVYNWYDSEGNFVAQGKDLYIANAVAEKYKLEVISSIDGYKDYTDVEVSLKPSRLISMSPNPSLDRKTTVYYKINEANSAYIMVTNYYMTPNGMSSNYIVDVNATEKFIDISSYPIGFYKVALVVDGVIMDVKILSTL
jgi:serine protease